MAHPNQAFTSLLLDWYERNKRHLPWRTGRDPYQIWLSEIILQQTRVAQGLPYFERFIEKFPSVDRLAAATEQEVLSLWQGLGYYSRARNLHQCAQSIVDNHKSIFPSDYASLIKLKGVGAYTAAAIASIAFGQNVPVIDGNVFRVVARVFGIYDDIAEPKSRRKFQAVLEELIPEGNPGDFNQAMMEFGALQCVPANPDCMACILRQQCHAFKVNNVRELPVKRKKINVKERYLHYLVFENGDTLLFRERKGKDIWQGLHDFYCLEHPHALSTNSLENELERLLTGIRWELCEVSQVYKHVLTHRMIFAVFFRVAIFDEHKMQDLSRLLDLKPVDSFNWEDIPKPTLIAKYLRSRQNLFNSI